LTTRARFTGAATEPNGLPDPSLGFVLADHAGWARGDAVRFEKTSNGVEGAIPIPGSIAGRPAKTDAGSSGPETLMARAIDLK
jgi:hypothetical protein